MILENKARFFGIDTIDVKDGGAGRIIDKDKDPTAIICETGFRGTHSRNIAGLRAASRDMNTWADKYIIYPVPDL